MVYLIYCMSFPVTSDEHIKGRFKRAILLLTRLASCGGFSRFVGAMLARNSANRRTAFHPPTHHAITSCLLLLSVAVAAITATSPLASNKDNIKPRKEKKNTYLGQRMSQFIFTPSFLADWQHRNICPDCLFSLYVMQYCMLVHVYEGTPTYLQKFLGGRLHGSYATISIFIYDYNPV